jgi:RimK family alpha-L-glutamate ligase
LKAAIIAAKDGWHIRELTGALNKRGFKIDFFPFTGLYASIHPGSRVGGRKDGKSLLSLNDYDFVFVRFIPGGSLEQIILRMDILHHLEDLSVRVVNSAGSIEKTVDKYYTLAILEKAGFPVPRTLVTENYQEAMKFFLENRDVVLKPLFGSLGRGMVRLTDEDTAYRVFKAWEMNNFIFYLQNFIPHNNRDIRVFVVKNEVIGGYVRKSDSWRTNIARGGKGEKYKLDSVTRNLALGSVAELGLDYAGVDIIMAEGKVDGPRILEVNSIPGWKELEKISGKSIASEVIDRITG